MVNTPQHSNDKAISRIKTPPHSIEAEQSVIGGLMLDNTRWDSISDLVSAEDFYVTHHRVLFTILTQMLTENLAADVLTVSDALNRADKEEAAGGFAYLVELTKNTPSAANIEAYAHIVAERALVRKLISMANEIAEAGYDLQGRSPSDLLDMAESQIFAITQTKGKITEGPKSVKSVIKDTMAHIEMLVEKQGNGITGLDTGFNELNKKTAGLQNSDLIIVAARPSMGKTTFAMNLCENVALHPDVDKPVLIFSLEMPANQLMMRLLSSLSRVEQNKIRTAQLNDEDWGRMSGAMNILLQTNRLYIDDSSGLTPNELRSRARKLAREHGGLSMIMIDYLQLMRVPLFKDNRTLEISEISRSLKALAKELNVPVVALSQLNRSLEQRADKRPINSDLRESGAIEQDADLIMFIYRDEVYHPDSPYQGMAEIIIGKQRNGPIGDVKLTFRGHISRFENYAPEMQYGDD